MFLCGIQKVNFWNIYYSSNLGSVRFWKNYTFIQEGCIKLKTDSKGTYNLKWSVFDFWRHIMCQSYLLEILIKVPTICLIHDWIIWLIRWSQIELTDSVRSNNTLTCDFHCGTVIWNTFTTCCCFLKLESTINCNCIEKHNQQIPQNFSFCVEWTK